MNANSALVGLPPEIQGKIAAYVSIDSYEDHYICLLLCLIEAIAFSKYGPQQLQSRLQTTQVNCSFDFV